MNKVELIESLKAKHKIESVENALIFVQAVVREVTVDEMKKTTDGLKQAVISGKIVASLNGCASSLTYVEITLKAWGVKMKIYIAGKITGDNNYKAKFAAVQKEFEEQGNIVLNPALLPSGMTEGDYMRICLAMIDTADMVYFLPDSNDSNGASLERDYCAYTHKKYVHR